MQLHAVTHSKVTLLTHYDFQLSKARGKFGDKVLTFKLPRCQWQLAPFPRETTSFSVKAREKLSDAIDSCSVPFFLFLFFCFFVLFFLTVLFSMLLQILCNPYPTITFSILHQYQF